jgi:hypothetical protein
MPYFLVSVRGNADQACGLLARTGIQSITSQLSGVEAGTNQDASEVRARLSAATPEEAEQRVRDALAEGAFTVGPAMRD